MEIKSKQQLRQIAESIVQSKETISYLQERFDEKGEFNDSRRIIELKNYIKMLLKNSPWRTAKEAEDYLN